MKKLISITCLAFALVWITACDFGSSPDDVVTGDVLDTLTSDNGLDSVDDDIVQPLDISGDSLTPDVSDVQTNDVNLNQCEIDEECEACMICTELQGFKQCVATPEAGMKECYAHDDCISSVCHPDKAGHLECGGSCGEFAAYHLREWGVNVVTETGDATMQAGPLKYYGAIAAKPVIYIYSNYEFALDVAIEFDSGVSAETWPVIPNSKNVVWKGVQVGTKFCEPTATPQPDMSGMAEIDSLEIYDLPEWVIADANCLTYGDTVSKLLFYSGPFQDYQPSLTPAAEVDSLAGKVTFNIGNSFNQAIGPVIALYRATESTCMDPSYCPVHTADLAFKVIDSIPSGPAEDYDADLVHLEKEVTEEDPYPSIEALVPSGWTDLTAQMQTMLADAGLDSLEIAVFMAAWQQTFFGLLGEDANFYYPSYHNGAFLIYVWPNDRTEQKLPMTLVPEPATKARAMVEYQQVTVTSTPL